MLRKYLRFLAVTFTVNLQSAMAYRANFLIQILGMMLNNAAFALFWHFLIQRTGPIAGYGFEDVMFIWAISSCSFGIAHVLAGNAGEISRIIREGELDTFLLQPKDVWLHVLVSRTVVSAWGDIIYGWIVIALLPGLDPARILLFALLSLSGAAVMAASIALVQSLSFFVGSTEAFARAFFESLLSFSLYPDKIFATEIRWLFYSLIPAGAISFLPRSIWFAQGESAWWAGLALAATVAAWIGASYLLFRIGLRRYESGNRIVTRQ